MSITIEEIVKKINDGTLKYRLVGDTDEKARGKVDLRNRTFENTPNLIDCSLDNADLENSTFKIDMHGVSFENASLHKCNFFNVEIESAFFLGSNLSMATGDGLGFVRSTFNNTIFNNFKFTSSNFTECEIIKCNMNNITFKDSEITKSIFTGCIIENAKFVNTNLLLTGFYKKNEDDEVPYPLFKNSSFIDLTIDACDLNELLLKNIEMSQVNVSDTTFDECIFDSFYIYDCTFINSGFVKTLFKNLRRDQVGNNTIENTDLSTIMFEGDIELEDIFIINIREDNIRIDNPYQNIGFYDRDEPEEVEDDEEDEEYDEAPEGLSNKDKCFWPFGPYDVKNTDYLTNPNHFLIQLPGSSSNYECGSLNDMKRTASLKDEFNLRENDYKGFYECSQAIMEKVRESGTVPLAFGPGDFNDAVEYVQFGTASRYYVRKPEWLWDGPIPEPKKFKLVQEDSTALKYFVSKSVVKYNGNVVSDTHCDLGDNGYVYRLEPILEGGKRVKKTNKKTNKKVKKNKKTIKKVKKNKKTVKKVKKNKKTVKKVKKNKITRKLKN
jgi:uncharacterized protein YjbI with pentapeptide repeats